MRRREVRLKVGEREFDLTRTEPFIEHVFEVVSKVRQKKIAEIYPRATSHVLSAAKDEDVLKRCNEFFGEEVEVYYSMRAFPPAKNYGFMVCYPKVTIFMRKLGEPEDEASDHTKQYWEARLKY